MVSFPDRNCRCHCCRSGAKYNEPLIRIPAEPLFHRSLRTFLRAIERPLNSQGHMKSPCGRAGLCFRREEAQVSFGKQQFAFYVINISKAECSGRACTDTGRLSALFPEGAAGVTFLCVSGDPVERNRTVRAGIGAAAAADAFGVIVDHQALRIAVHGPCRAYCHTAGIFAVVAGAGKINPSPFANLEGVHPPEELTCSQRVLLFTCHLAGLAADASGMVIYKAFSSHKSPPSKNIHQFGNIPLLQCSNGIFPFFFFMPHK